MPRTNFQWNQQHPFGQGGRHPGRGAGRFVNPGPRMYPPAPFPSVSGHQSVQSPNRREEDLIQALTRVVKGFW